MPKLIINQKTAELYRNDPLFHGIADTVRHLLKEYPYQYIEKAIRCGELLHEWDRLKESPDEILTINKHQDDN